MFGISHFLERFKSLQIRDAAFRGVVQAAVKKHAGIEVATENMKKKSNEIILEKLSSEARSVIFMKKAQILAEINQSEILKHIKNIR